MISIIYLAKILYRFKLLCSGHEKFDRVVLKGIIFLVLHKQNLCVAVILHRTLQNFVKTILQLIKIDKSNLRSKIILYSFHGR